MHQKLHDTLASLQETLLQAEKASPLADRELLKSLVKQANLAVEQLALSAAIDREKHALLETIADGYVVQNSDLVVERHNPAACAILGLSSQELRNANARDPLWKPVKEDGSPYLVEEFPAAIAIRTGRAVKGAIMGLKIHEQPTRWIRINAHPYDAKLHGQASSVRKVLCSFSDVTELVASRFENKFILESLRLGTWKLNPVTGSLSWDDSMYELFDIERKSFTGDYQAWEASLTAQARNKATSELEEAIRGRKDFDTTFEINTRDGIPRFIGVRAKVVRDESGNPLMVYGINWDVTNIKAAEQELIAKEKLISTILDTIPVGFFAKDITNEFRYTLVNRQASELFGVKAQDCIGKNDFEMFPKDQAEFFRGKDIEASKSENVVVIPQEVLDSPQGPVTLRTRKIVVRDASSRAILLLGITEDISEQIRLKETLDSERAKALLNAKLASLGEMSAGIAHEINNPLAIISGTLEQLKETPFDPALFGRKIESLQRSVERISKIVKGLKKFARSGGKAAYARHDLNEIAREVLVLTDAKSKRHFTSVTLEGCRASTINCDEVEIEQVLINLVNNAIDAVKDNAAKWVKVEISVSVDSVILRITDSGAGIAADLRGKLFQPFFTTKPPGEGTGLGLSIVKGILDDHNATIKLVPDSPNTCFEIRFPRGGEA